MPLRFASRSVEFSMIALETLIGDIARCLIEKQQRIATVESCTGGGIAYYLTNRAGSSEWFDGGFVTYSNEAKYDMVGVSRPVLEKEGAVSEAVASQMAKGGLERLGCDYCLSVTGVAGPGGGSKDKPVGMVCFGWASDLGVETQIMYFDGSRENIRLQTIEHSLRVLRNKLRSD